MMSLKHFWLTGLILAVVMLVVGRIAANLILPAPLTYYHSQHVSVTLPPGWWCGQRRSAFLCRSTAGRNAEDGTHRARQALIVFSIEYMAPHYTFSNISNYLETPRPIDSVEGLAASIVERKTYERVIGGHRWLSATHLHSELPHYRTQYMTTVTPEFTVMVSFTAHKLYADVYQEDFDTAMDRLELHLSPAKAER